MFKKISLFFFFYFSITSVYVIFLPKILSQIGYSSIQIGVIFSASPLIRFILPFIFRKYFTLNENILKIALYNLFFTAIFFYISIDYFWIFLIANIFFGASMGVILPYIESYSLIFLKKQRYGKARLFGSIGFILIALVLAKILDNPYAGLHFLFLNIIMTIICAFWIVNKDFTASKTTVKSTFNILKHFRFWLSLFLLQVSFGAFYNFFTIYETSFGFSLQMVSFMWIFGVICEILLFYFQAPFLKKIPLLKIIKFACFITSIRWFILFLYPDNTFLVFFSQALHGISFALLHSAAFSYLHTLYKDKALASQFYYGISYGLGGALGSLVAGISYGKYVFFVSFLIAFSAFFTCKKS